MSRIGLIAGNGSLPGLFAKAAVERGVELVVIPVTPQARKNKFLEVTDEVYPIGVGELDEIISTLQDKEVEEVVMLGKVTKELLYQGIKLDARFKKLLASLPEKNDDTIMRGLAKEFTEAGLKIKDQTEFIEDLLPNEGILTEIEPSPEVRADMEYGFELAKKVGRLDIGQTVVVKDKAVMAVEAIEGTDQAILRGGDLGNGEIVVAKVSKPNQDLRFDIPTVGIKTLENLIEVNARGLVIEANKTFIIKQAKFIEWANQAEIPVVAMEKNN
jgi:DUF1009 family protein